MLKHLYVKNLALIKSCNIDFGKGLNILTGETGAGKSILIDSINLALGKKASADFIRTGCEYGLVQLLFTDFTDAEIKKIKAMGFPVEDGNILIERKLMEKRSELRINDELFTLSKLKDLSALLIDIHGQHEHQSLLAKDAPRKIIDEYMDFSGRNLIEKYKEEYKEFRKLKEDIKNYNLDDKARDRELDFLNFEIEEIENAGISEGEEEKLLEKYRRYENFGNIRKSLDGIYSVLRQIDFSSNLRELKEESEYDEDIKQIVNSAYDIIAITDDSKREIEDYLDSAYFDEEDFYNISKRLDEIRSVLSKHGNTYEDLMEALDEKKKRRKELKDYEKNKNALLKEIEQKERVLYDIADSLSHARKMTADTLKESIVKELMEMGFNYVSFEFSFKESEKLGINGKDEIVFMISLNKGESLKELSKVASGGELSRIMLSIKTVLSEKDEINTLIFDEIDTGISGRTAEKVSVKLKKIANNHQVILITHLPQIASKAKYHFLIEKTLEGNESISHVKKLSDEESVMELARLLAGGSLSDAAILNARELKSSALR